MVDHQRGMLPTLAIGLLLAAGVDATFLGMNKAWSQCASDTRGGGRSPEASDDDSLSDIEMDTFQPVTQSVCAESRRPPRRRFSRLRGVVGLLGSSGRRRRRAAKTAEPETTEEELPPLPSVYHHYDW